MSSYDAIVHEYVIALDVAPTTRCLLVVINKYCRGNGFEPLYIYDILRILAWWWTHEQFPLSHSLGIHWKGQSIKCPKRFLGMINQDPSVSKSDRLHVAIFRFFFISLRYLKK